jgi:hypothetical protein
LRVDSLAPGQHLYELLDASGSGLNLLCAFDPIEDGVPVRTRELEKHRSSTGIGGQGVRQVFRNFRAGLSGIGDSPTTVGFCPPNFVFPRSMHSAGGAQSLGDGDVPLRPRAPRISGCESSTERYVVAAPELTIDPAKANCLVECVIVRECRRICSALLGKDEPYSLRLGLVATQPCAPFGSISDQQLRKIHSVTVSPRWLTVAPSRRTGHFLNPTDSPGRM